MVDCKLKKNRSLAECKAIMEHRCMRVPADKMPIKKIESCINELIFDPPKNLKATDPELLTTVVLKKKKKHFDFLIGKTTWNVLGDWTNPETGKSFPAEKNIQMDVQFKDRKDEMVGQKLIELFNALNKKKVKEELLYTRTVPVEETSL